MKHGKFKVVSKKGKKVSCHRTKKAAKRAKGKGQRVVKAKC